MELPQPPQELEHARAVPKTTTTTPPWLDFVAGGVAGAAGIAAGAPLDVVRIRQQAGQVPPGLSLWRALLSLATREGGGTALFKGATYPLATASFQNAVVFLSEKAAFRWLSAPGRQQQQQQPQQQRRALLRDTFFAGCFAGAVQSPLTSAVELLKIRAQLNGAAVGSSRYLSAAEVARRVIKGEGAMRGLTRGLGLTLLRDAPSYGVYFFTYALARDAAEAALLRSSGGGGGGKGGSSSSSNSASNALVQLGAGGLAGVVAWASIFPVDVVKSRVQASPSVAVADAALRTAPPERPAGVGALAVARRAYREEGARAFSKGMGATLWRAFLVNGVIFYVFEGCTALIVGGG
jgi:solute carrier family 25 carnitine/acylcarnitine transporter 20/29